MSLLWVEGFEGYGTVTSGPPLPLDILGRKYTVGSDDSNLRIGRLDNCCYDYSSINVATRTPVINNHATLIIGFAIKVYTDFNFTTYPFLKLWDGVDLGINLTLVAGGEIAVKRGNDTLATTSGAGLLFDVWYWIEFKVTINNTTGSYELRIGGVNILSDSGIDTQSGSNAYCDSVQFRGSPTAGSFRIDDWYVCNGDGSVNNDFLGNMRVSAIFPSEAGNSTQWTPSAGDNYDCVDENPANDDTDYVETDTVGYKDLYGYDSLGAISGIKGIQINTQCRETDASSFSLITPIRSGGTDYDDSAQAIGTTNYTAKMRVAELDPDTSAAWTYTGINNAEFGIKVG